MFVDGPYKNVANASASAASLNGTEYAARGGLYVVTATLRGHLGSLVPEVAGCLERTTTSKPDSSGYAF